MRVSLSKLEQIPLLQAFLLFLTSKLFNYMLSKSNWTLIEHFMGIMFHGNLSIFRSIVLKQSWTLESLSEFVKNIHTKSNQLEFWRVEACRKQVIDSQGYYVPIPGTCDFVMQQSTIKVTNGINC